MSVRLAPGVDPVRAISEVRQLAGGSAAAVRAGSRGSPADARDDYVRWAINVEVRLASVLDRSDARAIFESPRHRDICSMPPGNQLVPLIYAEVDAVARSMGEAANYLEAHLNRMRAAPGVPVVVDSNVLLQCQRLDYLSWQTEIANETRVMVPLRVIEEIDARKSGESKRLREVARGLLPWIDSLFPDGSPGPVRLRDGATIELVLAERPRYRPADADEEILDLAHDVLRFAGTARIMTADTGMRVRARSEGLDVLFVPPDWLRQTKVVESPRAV